MFSYLISNFQYHLEILVCIYNFYVVVAALGLRIALLTLLLSLHWHWRWCCTGEVRIYLLTLTFKILVRLKLLGSRASQN